MDHVYKLGHAFEQGGSMMYVIAATLVWAIVLIWERWDTLSRKMDVDGASFMAEVQKFILAEDLDGAIRLCNGAGRAALARVFKAGLSRASRTAEQIQNAIDATSLEVIAKIEKRISHLSLIGNVATLLGLLGTIIGLMTAFEGLATADPSKRSEILSNGIAEAMNCTAFGLFTAILAMVAHGFLSAKASKIVGEVDEYSVKLMDWISARDIKLGGGKGGR